MYHKKCIQVIIEQWVPFFKIKTVHRKNVTLALYRETANVLKSCFIQEKQILYKIADISFFFTH